MFNLLLVIGKRDYCCVPVCKARRDDGKMRAFHQFPCNDMAELRKKWIINICRDVGQGFKITRETVVCSDHFLDSDYSGAVPPRTDKERAAVRGQRHLYRLKSHAVPRFSQKEIDKVLHARAPPCVRSVVSRDTHTHTKNKTASTDKGSVGDFPSQIRNKQT